MKATAYPFILVLSTLLTIGQMTAAGPAAAKSPQPKKAAVSGSETARNILKFGVHVSAMGNLDPHRAAGSQDRAFADMVFNGLLRYEPGNAPKIEPDLAERIPTFKMVNGNQVWTINLRKGVMFHPGPKTAAYELNADDVIFSLRKSADKARSAYSGEYEGLAFEKKGRYAVSIELRQPLSPTLFLPKLTNYAGGFIVSKKAVEEMGYDQFSAHPIGTGPFMFKRHQPGERLDLTAHEQYFRGRPRLDGVNFQFLPETADREAAFRAGKVDVIITAGDIGWIEKMEQLEGVVVDTHGVGEVVSVFFNTQVAPMNDLRVRQALAYALSRDAFLSTTNKRMVGPVYSSVPRQFLPGGLDKTEVVQFGLDYAADLDKARELLSEAGFPDGFSLSLVGSEKRLYQRCYEVLRDQLAKIGVICNVQVVPHSDMHKAIRKSPKPLVIYTAWRPNADAYLTRFFHSDSIVLTGAKPDTNFSHYSAVDRLIEDARLAIDPEKQISLWSQAQIRILNDMAAYPIMFIKLSFVRRSYVDYGHQLNSTMALYPQFTEMTQLLDPKK